jgi:uncharacterized RDD family membrane protein YckC
MMIPHVFTMLMPLLLAFVLAGLMAKYRVTHYSWGEKKVIQASLVKRAFSQIIDFLILGFPMAAGGVFMIIMFSDIELMIEKGPLMALSFIPLFLGSFLWLAAGILAFSWLEGRWGVTPGKYILGIRVVGMDLQPCGFGRALIRNLLKFVDGFFNFIVGITTAALTENRQRVGDLAARTIVVEKNN